jgi:SAM-dependent methyltransferase
MATNLEQIKSAQQQAWPTGDYQRVVNHMNLMKMSDILCDSVQVLPQHRVLDVATGTGNSAIAAKRRGFPHVTGVDYATDLLDIAVERARAEQLDITFEPGDAESLPFPDDSFDVVISTCGVMFAPDQEKAASELVRVCRPGGRIGVTAWIPEGDIASFNKTIASYVPPPPDAPSPMNWGTAEGAGGLLGDQVDLEFHKRELNFPVRSVEYYIDLLLDNFGPAKTAMGKLDATTGSELRAELISVLSTFARPAGEGARIPGNYLEITGTVR